MFPFGPSLLHSLSESVDCSKIILYFTDNIPQGTTFVENSVKINGSIVQGNRPDVGYNIAKLTPSQNLL